MLSTPSASFRAHYQSLVASGAIEADAAQAEAAEAFAALARINTLYMIAGAWSGHIGTSFSSIEIMSWVVLATTATEPPARLEAVASRPAPAPIGEVGGALAYRFNQGMAAARRSFALAISVAARWLRAHRPTPSRSSA